MESNRLLLVAQRLQAIAQAGLAYSTSSYDLERYEVVAREPVPPPQPADAATERQACDAGLADDAERRSEAVSLRRSVELASEARHRRRAAACRGSGGPPRVIAYVYGGQGTINVPSWSPDGRMVAFVSNTGSWR